MDQYGVIGPIELLSSEIYRPRGSYIRSMGVSRYRHNYEGFDEKSTY